MTSSLLSRYLCLCLVFPPLLFCFFPPMGTRQFRTFGHAFAYIGYATGRPWVIVATNVNESEEVDGEVL